MLRQKPETPQVKHTPAHTRGSSYDENPHSSQEKTLRYKQSNMPGDEDTQG